MCGQHLIGGRGRSSGPMADLAGADVGGNPGKMRPAAHP